MNLILDIKDEMSWTMAQEKIVDLREEIEAGWLNAYKQPRKNIVTVSQILCAYNKTLKTKVATHSLKPGS